MPSNPLHSEAILYKTSYVHKDGDHGDHHHHHHHHSIDLSFHFHYDVTIWG